MATRDIYETGFDEDARTESNANQCPECDGRVTTNAVETVCEDCSLVIDEHPIDHGPEWRGYGDDERKRTGAPLTVARHDRGLSTEIGRGTDAKGNELSGEKRRRLERLRREQARGRWRSKAERNLAHGLGEVRRIVSALELSASVRDQACQLFRSAQNEDLLRGRSIEAVAAASAYGACRCNGLSRPLQDVIEVAAVEHSRVENAYRVLNREQGLPTVPPSPIDFVHQITSELGLSDGTRRHAEQLAARTLDEGIGNGCHPAGIAVFAALTGALFVSPDSGGGWYAITVTVYRETVLILLARPFLVLGVVGLGYLAHLVEYQRHITDLDRDRSRTRPRWQYLTVCAVGGLVGWFGWVVSQLNVLAAVLLPVGVLVWSAGAFGLVYFLNETLLEDRWSYGLQIHPGIWKFPVQYSVGLMLYDGVLGLPGPESNAIAVAVVPPVVGLCYAARRYLAFTERGAAFSRWVRQVTYRSRQVIPWPTKSRLRRRGGSPETNQFGQLDAPTRDEYDRGIDGGSGLGRAEELRQTREWASYLESELHDRETQLQDLEARMARVQQELQETREAESNDGPAARERDGLLTDLFDIRDNFRRALDAETCLADNAPADLSEGIELIDRQIKSIFQREGVEEIDTSGTVDPTRHRVVETVPAAEAAPGEIVDVYQLGYRLDDRVLREAHVVVAEDPATAEDGDRADDSGQINRGGDVS